MSRWGVRLRPFSVGGTKEILENSGEKEKKIIIGVRGGGKAGRRNNAIFGIKRGKFLKTK